MFGESYRVSFIGHRQVERFWIVEKQVDKIVRELIRTKEFVEFYVGRNGGFDIMVASVIERAQRDLGMANNALILVIPYQIANLEDMEKFYDEVWYPDELYGVHYKLAITKRKEWFVDRSGSACRLRHSRFQWRLRVYEKSATKRICVAQISGLESD